MITTTLDKFVVKSAEEIKALIEGEKFDELAEYYNQKNDQTRIELQGLIDAKASSEDVQKAADSIREDMIKQMDNLNSALKAQGLAIKQLVRGNDGGKPETVDAQIKNGLALNLEKLKTMKNGSASDARSAGFDFEVKAPATMTFGNVSGGNIPVEDRLEGFNTIPSRNIRLLDIMSKRGTTSNVVSWVYQANKDGAAGQTGEGLAKNQIDFDLVVASESVKKTTAFIKVSTEMLDDIDWIRSEIQTELFKELLKAVEAGAYEGNGTGNNLNGVLTTATAFAAGTFAATIDNANIVDVLTVAVNQIKIAEHDAPNYILMHPSDVTGLKMVKVSSTDKRYVERLANVGGNMSLDGIPIIETTLVTVDKYLVGNFDLSLLVTKQGIRIDIGLDSDDFSKNLRTILAEWRGLVIVKNNNRTAFVTGDFSTDAAALETA